MEEKIIKMLQEINEDIIDYQGENMLADDLIDSFGIIQIIANLEDAFDIEIDAADVTIENFGNKNKIFSFIKSLITE